MAKVIRYTKYGYEIYDTETMSYKMLDSSYIHVSDFVDGFAKVLSHKNDRSLYGYINENGDEVVPAIYTEVSDRYKGYVFAKRYCGGYGEPHENWYILNLSQGACVKCPIKQPRYDVQVDYVRCEGSGIISTMYSLESWRSIKHYKLTERGELTPFLSSQNCEITLISNYCNAYALARERTIEEVPYGGNSYSTYKREKNTYIVIDDNGNIVRRLNNLLLYRYIEDAYRTFGYLSHVEGSIYHYSVPTHNTYSPDQDVFIDIEADSYGFGEYDYCDIVAHCGLRRVYRHNQGWGYINEKNIEVIACQYRKAAIFIDNIARVETQGSGYCNIDIYGETVKEKPILHNLHYRYGLATFNMGNITATVDRGMRNYCRYENAELYIPGFIAVDTFVKGVAIAVDQNKKCGIIDIGGNRLSEFIYDNVYDDGEYIKTHIGDDKDLFCSDSVWSITLKSKKAENKYGYLSREGSILVKCEYDYLSKIENGIVRGYKDGRLCIIDIKKNKTSYYTLNNWLIDIGHTAELYIMQYVIFPYLSQEQKSTIVSGVKSGKWKVYYTMLERTIDNYIDTLNFVDMLDKYRIEYKVETYCRPGDKDDDCDAYLTANYKDNQDIYLNNILLYRKTLFSASHYSAWVEFCSWQRTEECQNAKSLASTLTEEKINYFKQHYSKDEHRKTLVKHIHNELKKKAIAEEISRWIEPYKNMVK